MRLAGHVVRAGVCAHPLGCASADVHPFKWQRAHCSGAGCCPLTALTVRVPVQGPRAISRYNCLLISGANCGLALQKLHDYSPKFSVGGTVILMLISKHQIKR